MIESFFSDLILGFAIMIGLAMALIALVVWGISATIRGIGELAGSGGHKTFLPEAKPIPSSAVMHGEDGRVIAREATDPPVTPPQQEAVHFVKDLVLPVAGKVAAALVARNIKHRFHK